MEPFTLVEGVAAPLMRQNVDTDVIIRIERINLGRRKLESYCFESWRYLPNGESDPGFLLNQPPYDTAKILLNGENFGCGSSREAAVWALQCFGIRCVIAPSFGDIFFMNCLQNGVLPIVLPLDTVEEMAAEARGKPDAPFMVSLLANTVTLPSGRNIAFSIDSGQRDRLLQGLDDLGLTLQREPEIAAFQARDRVARPWVYDVGNK
jgi:3-isopropylmalate/(R)-2-methylmalate dehydratase small subunit